MRSVNYHLLQISKVDVKFFMVHTLYWVLFRQSFLPFKLVNIWVRLKVIIELLIPAGVYYTSQYTSGEGERKRENGGPARIPRISFCQRLFSWQLQQQIFWNFCNSHHSCQLYLSWSWPSSWTSRVSIVTVSHGHVVSWSRGLMVTWFNGHMTWLVRDQFDTQTYAISFS